MHKLLPLASCLPLFTASSSRSIEAAARPAPLMERAGRAVARLALALQPDGPIWIACGPGNNGGDGLVAARLLQGCGQRVFVSLIDGQHPADAAAVLSAARQAGVPISTEMVPPIGITLAIDALLGLGLSRAPNDAMAAAIRQLNALSGPVLAVDLPSGLRADTGALAGSDAVRARHTLSLLTLKPGLFTAQGRAHGGELWFDDLGVEPQRPADAELIGRDSLAGWAARSADSHKGSFGDVLVIGGAPGLRGAALLAARAALSAGAGRVYVDLLGDRAAAVDTDLDTQRPELMRWRGAAVQDQVLVCGCGGGDEIAARLPALFEQARRLVLDADALNAVAADASLRHRLIARRNPSILTPHPLEAARLLGCSTAEAQADRLQAAQALADQLQATVVLKGSGSLVASPGRRPAINSSGSAALATAGTGDVLAGWLGGLWAQRPDADPQALACAAVYWHGEAGETQTAGPLRAADLVERMAALHRRR